MTYTLDSNILINLERLYPRDIFGSIWDAIESAIADRRACICEVVLIELERGGDDLPTWAKSMPGFVCSALEGEMALARSISEDHPEWVKGDLNYGDPFVIAHAKCDGRTLVTEETRKGKGTLDKNLKIPNVADEHDVRTVKFFDYLRENDWQF